MMLELRDINKTYLQGKLEVPVLNGISLSVAEGEYLAIMGPSGSGKTTLMNIIGCLDNPSSGEYILEGEDIAQVSEKRMSEVRLHSIGFVFQSFYLLSRQSAIDNVALPLLYAGVRRRERMEIARKALERVGLGDRTEFKPTQLSGGQCQRVAIARAIVNSPKILLADEPTGALDTKSGEQIMEIFRRLNEEGVTIVMITHEPEIAAHAKRTLHIRDGLLVDGGGVRRERPAPKPELSAVPPAGGLTRQPKPQPPIVPRSPSAAGSGPAAPLERSKAGEARPSKGQKPAQQAPERRPEKTAPRQGERPAGKPGGSPPARPAVPQEEQVYSRLEPRQKPLKEKQEPGRPPEGSRKPKPRPENAQAKEGQGKRPKNPKPENKSRSTQPPVARPASVDQPLKRKEAPQESAPENAGEDRSFAQPISGKSIIEALERQLKKLSEERDGTPENREESSDEQ